MAENICTIKGRDFIFEYQENAYDTSITLQSQNDGVYEYKISVTPLKINSGAMNIKWAYHMKGFLSTWCPIAGRRRQMDAQSARCSNHSNLYYGAPVFSVINYDDTNFSTVALSDAVNPARISFFVKDFEEKENLYYCVSLFEEWTPSSSYSLIIRIDERSIPFYEAIPSVSKWWKNFYPLDKPRSEASELPLYSTWYNYHQNPREDSLIQELSLASEYGLKSVIIDDGWSYEGRGPGDYRLCGDWNFCKDKFPDFKGFVQKLHSLGIKVSLWFPVPFVGYETPQYKEFENMLLYNGDRFKAGILDPRYPEVRSFLINTYVNTVKEYDLDGLKLDFIDAFKLKAVDRPCNSSYPGRDCESVEAGVTKLMQAVKENLTTLKSDFMIEQRQYYVGPGVVANCNMLRVLDCQFDFLTNRIGIADLRLMDYDLSVHADMLLWSHDETPQNVAAMLYNIMFGVPQISVRLKNTNSEQARVIKQYIEYWYKNRHTILHGKFKAFNPHMNYTHMSSENHEHKIEVLYSVNSTKVDKKTADIFNATQNDHIYLENVDKKMVSISIFNCFGEKLDSIETDKDLNRLSVPVGGYVEIR